MLAVSLLFALMLLTAAVVASYVEPDEKPPQKEGHEKEYSDAA